MFKAEHDRRGRVQFGWAEVLEALCRGGIISPDLKTAIQIRISRTEEVPSSNRPQQTWRLLKRIDLVFHAALVAGLLHLKCGNRYAQAQVYTECIDIELRNIGRNYQTVLVPTQSRFTCACRQFSGSCRPHLYSHSGVKFRLKTAAPIAAKYIVVLSNAKAGGYTTQS